MRFSISILLYAIALVSLFSACSTTKYLGEDEILLSKNKIHYSSPGKYVEGDDLYDFIKQHPNNRMLGIFNVEIKVYQMTKKGKERKLKNWLNRTIGEAPVLIDSSFADLSMEMMEQYLISKGFFNPVSRREIVIKGKKARIHYYIESGKPYLMRKTELLSKDTILLDILQSGKSETLLLKGLNYDVDVLDDERDRITRVLKEYGYYNFGKEYIHFMIDSSLNSHEVNVFGNIDLALVKDKLNDSLIEVFHKQYYIRNVFIFPEFDPRITDPSAYDTLIHFRKKLSFDPPSMFYFLDTGMIRVSPRIIMHSTYLNPGQRFSILEMEQTYSRLSALKIYRTTNIQIREYIETAPYAGPGLLDCDIRLTRAKVQGFTVETELTNTGGDFGVGGNFIYTNRNLFRGAEVFQMKLRGGMEVQRIADETNDGGLLPFNTYEAGIEFNLNIPRFLAPISMEKFPQVFQPVTNIRTGYNIRNRPTYLRHNYNLSLGYAWRESITRSHSLRPVVISFVKMQADSAFDPSIYGERYRDQYTDHLITALEYSFTYNDQSSRKGGNYNYFKGTVTPAGNLLGFIGSIADFQQTEEGFETAFGVRYTQFIRAIGDYRYYHKLRKKMLVLRTAAGIGIPYGNSVALPIDYAFYLGGANSMRGWFLRSLGPGSFYDAGSAHYDKLGEILLEGNAELRFDIFKYIKGAAFVDVGNIWLLKPSEEMPDGNWEWDKFATQIAMNAGLGMRLDFTFFIFRLDVAKKVRDPIYPEGERWIGLNHFGIGSVLWNFAIGYPF